MKKGRYNRTAQDQVHQNKGLIETVTFIHIDHTRKRYKIIVNID